MILHGARAGRQVCSKFKSLEVPLIPPMQAVAAKRIVDIIRTQYTIIEYS